MPPSGSRSPSHRYLSIVAVGLFFGFACGPGTKTSTGRTEREADSVIGQSKVPGAPAVRKALEVSDSGAARARAMDSIATSP